MKIVLELNNEDVARIQSALLSTCDDSQFSLNKLLREKIEKQSDIDYDDKIVGEFYETAKNVRDSEMSDPRDVAEMIAEEFHPDKIAMFLRYFALFLRESGEEDIIDQTGDALEDIAADWEAHYPQSEIISDDI